MLDDDGEQVPDGDAGRDLRAGPVRDARLLQAARAHGRHARATDGCAPATWPSATTTGFFYIVDRKKDMIVSGGFNVFPREIEDVLTTHPAVSTAAVIGVPDDKWGEAVKALVVLKPGRDASTPTS